MEQDPYLNVFYIFIYFNVESFSFIIIFSSSIIFKLYCILYIHFPFFSFDTLDIFLYKNEGERT